MTASVNARYHPGVGPAGSPIRCIVSGQAAQIPAIAGASHSVRSRWPTRTICPSPLDMPPGRPHECGPSSSVKNWEWIKSQNKSLGLPFSAEPFPNSAQLPHKCCSSNGWPDHSWTPDRWGCVEGQWQRQRSRAVKCIAGVCTVTGAEVHVQPYSPPECPRVHQQCAQNRQNLKFILIKWKYNKPTLSNPDQANGRIEVQWRGGDFRCSNCVWWRRPSHSVDIPVKIVKIIWSKIF